MTQIINKNIEYIALEDVLNSIIPFSVKIRNSKAEQISLNENNISFVKYLEKTKFETKDNIIDITNIIGSRKTDRQRSR